MKAEKILEDKSLEALGLIKGIDTISIIRAADLLKEKRKLKFKNVIFVMLVLLILSLNLFLIISAGIKIFILTQVFFSWIIPILFIPLLKNKFVLEV